MTSNAQDRSGAAAIDFYFDFSSPYAYIASAKIDVFAAQHGRAVRWHAILLGPIFKETGNAPNSAIAHKGDYTRLDVERLARLDGLAMDWPAAFPIGTVAAARAFHWLSDVRPETAVPFAKACFARYFGEGCDISAPEEVLAIGRALGVDAEALEAGVSDADVKQRLKDQTADALAKGVFGSPFFFVDGEPFWGADRFWLMKRFMARGGRWDASPAR